MARKTLTEVGSLYFLQALRQKALVPPSLMQSR